MSQPQNPNRNRYNPPAPAPAPTQSVAGSGGVDPETVLASRIYANNPRIPIVVDGQPVGFLRLMPAPNIRGVSGNKETGVAIELVVTDWQRLSTKWRNVNGRLILPIRIFNTDEAQRFFNRCISYTWQIHLINVLAVSLANIRQKYQMLKAQQRQTAPAVPMPVPAPAPATPAPATTTAPTAKPMTTQQQQDDEIDMR